MAADLPSDPASVRQRLDILASKKGTGGVSVADLKTLMLHAQHENSSLKAELQNKLSSVQQDFSAKLAKLQGDLDRGLQDAKKIAEVQARESQEKSERLQEGLRQKLQMALESSCEKLDRELQSLKADLQREAQRATSWENAAEQNASSLRTELLASMTELRSSTVASCDKLEAEQKRSTEATVSELQSGLEQLSQVFGNRLSQFQDRQATLDSAQDAEAMRSSTFFREELERLALRLNENRQLAEENLAAHAQTCNATLNQCCNWVHTNLEFFMDRTTYLRKLVAEVENMSTRRVEWTIPTAELEQNPSKSPSSSWMSPKFEAGGSHDLQLELLCIRPAAGSEQRGGEGDCFLRLWAKPGLYLMCKFYVGSASLQAEHTFEGSDPYSTRAICYLKDQINAGTENLIVGVEVLEAVRHVTQEPWPQVLADMPPSPSSPSTLSFWPPKSNSGTADVSAEHAVGTIISHRYLIHRTLELVEKQVDLMRSRMVRQIEWRLERASVLRRCFPEGECVCSTSFEAAGVDGLQLVFYPSGHKGAREGFCSYFLQCPAGSTIKCWLAAGKQRREASARLSFEKPGFFGRTNFCRFDHCIDPSDDSILLVLEIDEAEQTVTEALRHQAVGVQGQAFGESASPSSPASPLAKASGEQSVAGLPEKVESSVKLRRTPGKIGLEDVRQLPSIWTPRPVGDIAGTLEGFHSFNDLKVAKRPNSSRKHHPGVPWKTEITSSALHQTTSQLAQKYMMYAT